MNISTIDEDNVEIEDCFTFGGSQHSHVARQLLVMRAAAAILRCVVEYFRGCGSTQESTCQITGPQDSADQIEQHIEASRWCSDQRTKQ